MVATQAQQLAEVDVGAQPVLSSAAARARGGGLTRPASPRYPSARPRVIRALASAASAGSRVPRERGLAVLARRAQRRRPIRA